MKLEMTGQMRMEQKMKLAPHMIQSMEILQLPLLALAERIDQELNSNPVLEIDEGSGSQENGDSHDQNMESEPAEIKNDTIDNLDQIRGLDEDYTDYMNRSDSYTRSTRVRDDEPDRKLEAIKNTAAPPQSLHDHLSDQWRLVEASDAVKTAGEMIIDYIDDRGYLSVRIEQLHNKDRKDYNLEDLHTALELVQKVEPAGVGARDLAECLLIQLRQSGENYVFEEQLVAKHLNELLENRLPDIAKKMNCNMDRLNVAIKRLSKLDTSPGLQVSQPRNHPITADVIVEKDEDQDVFTVRLADSSLPTLKINDDYAKMVQEAGLNNNTKKFLQTNIRSAQWIIDAIEQRKNTLLKVSSSVVKNQKEFFEKGPLHLKPLPMSKVADEVGVHVATVSRAVAGKYLQCSRGIIPLRKFFSGGTEDVNGNEHSWEAIRGKLQQIIDSEDKAKPLSDDKIRERLVEAGIENLARRTIAKYRKLMNIPPARLRKKF